MGYVLEECDDGVKIVADNLFVTGYIGGGDLPASFYPALLGLHHPAVASDFGYNANGLLTTVTWSSPGSYDVEQTLSYNVSGQLTQIVTQGAGLSTAATETFTWTGDNLTGYTISFT